MRLLSLVRHAKSSWDYPELSDFERPLNDRGRRDAPRMAEHVLPLMGLPDRLISSPASRAITTARHFADVMQIDERRLSVQPQIYEASEETLLELVRRLDDRDSHVMLFGHNPGFTELAHALARCPFDDLPTCAVVQIELPVKVWHDVSEQCGRVLHHRFPKQLRD